MNGIGRKIVLAMAFLSYVLLFSGTPLSRAQPFGIGSAPRQASQQQVLCSGCARFVFGQVSESSKDQFMLDTATGRLWRMSESGKAGDFLRPVMYRIGEDAYTPVPVETEGEPSKKPQRK